jgi:hypothetical protein
MIGDDPAKWRSKSFRDHQHQANASLCSHVQHSSIYVIHNAGCGFDP